MSAVWIVNHYAANPRDSATGSRHFSLARRLGQLGWAPVVIAASSEHNSRRQRDVGEGHTGTDSRDGVTFRWLRTSSYSGNGVGRVLNMLQFTVALLRPRSTRDLATPSVVIGSTVHPLAAWAASRLARRHGVPFVFEIRDLWPQTLIDMGRLTQNGIPARLMRALERYLCREAARVVTLLPNAVEYLATIGVPEEKVEWISNGTDVADFASTPVVEHDPFTFLYFGSLGRANGLPAILEAFAQASVARPSASMRLLLVGEGPEKRALQDLARARRVDNRIEFIDAVPKDQIPAIAAGADALVLNLLDLPLYRYGISLNKLFDYMAARRPIIIGSTAVNNPVRDAEGGISVPSDDPPALAAAMLAVLDAPVAQRVLWGANASGYVAEHFDYSVLGEKLDMLLRGVTSTRDSAQSQQDGRGGQR